MEHTVPEKHYGIVLSLLKRILLSVLNLCSPVVDVRFAVVDVRFTVVDVRFAVVDVRFTVVYIELYGILGNNVPKRVKDKKIIFFLL